MRVIPDNTIRYGKVIAALMSAEVALMDEIERQLAEQFGACDLRSETFSFDAFSGYYAKEMGTGLMKRFLSFSELVSVEDLPAIKRMTNALELRYTTQNGGRRANIDPGIVDFAQMVLATTKPYTHRIYLGQGIHAELTYVCRKRVFHPLEWTYPDYREPWAIAFFEQARQRYLKQMRARREKDDTPGKP